MTPWPDLRPVLQGIPWAVVGGVATRAYMPERSTKDLDVLVRHADGEEVQGRLEEAGYTVEDTLAIPGFVVRAPDGTEVDVILGDFHWLEEALGNLRADPAGYPTLDLPYLVLMKLATSRIQDTADLSRMLGFASEAELDRVREVISLYVPDEMEDIEALIYLGRMEIQEKRSSDDHAAK